MNVFNNLGKILFEKSREKDLNKSEQDFPRASKEEFLQESLERFSNESREKYLRKCMEEFFVKFLKEHLMEFLNISPQKTYYKKNIQEGTFGRILEEIKLLQIFRKISYNIL